MLCGVQEGTCPCPIPTPAVGPPAERVRAEVESRSTRPMQGLGAGCTSASPLCDPVGCVRGTKEGSAVSSHG